MAQISEDAMTALSLVYPVQNLINAVTIGFGIGSQRGDRLFTWGPRSREKADSGGHPGPAAGSAIHGVDSDRRLHRRRCRPSCGCSPTTEAGHQTWACATPTVAFAFAVDHCPGHVPLRRSIQAVGKHDRWPWCAYSCRLHRQHHSGPGAHLRPGSLPGTWASKGPPWPLASARV